MHEPIRARLEEYLDNPTATGRAFQEHISECRGCEEELRRLRKHSALMRLLRAGDAAPDAGFYARVIARIDAEAKPSVWWLLHDAAFGWRVALASAGMALIMAGYMASTGFSARPAADAAMSKAPRNILALDFGSPAQMDQARNSVLATLASFQE